LNAYGNRCACCGELEPRFLTIDHINNDGPKHRKSLGIGAGAKFYKWVVRNKFPSFLQLLCWNCNQGRRLNHGICPHKVVTSKGKSPPPGRRRSGQGKPYP
jgi:hypothetical protein